MNKNFKLSNNSLKNIKGIDDRLQILVVNTLLYKSEHDFGIPRDGGMRTAERRNELYQKTNPRVTWVDGYEKKSYHQSGKAFDVFLYDEHGACWDCTDKYTEIYLAIKQEFDEMKKEGIFRKYENLEWGGNWKKKDLPHFQLV